MKSTKKIICLLLCAAMALSLLAACGGQGEETNPSSSATESATEAATVPEATVPETTVAPTEPPVTHLTVAELETLLNEKLVDVGLPLEFTFNRNERTYGHFLGDFSYTGEYTDNPETNMLIMSLSYLFSTTVYATGITKDSFVREIVWEIPSYASAEFTASAPEFSDSLPGLSEEFASFIAQALDRNVAEDIVTQLATLDPNEINDNGIIIVYMPTIVSGGLVCGIEDTGSNPRFYFYVIDLLSSKFDPYIPHGDEVNEPQYLKHEFEIGNHVMSADYIPYFQELPKSASWLSGFCRGTYSPIEVDSFDYDEMSTYAGYKFIFEDNSLSLSGSLNTKHYAVYEYFDDHPTVTEIYTYYNTNYKEYFPQEYLSAGLDPEYTLRVPIGISLMFDEEMTTEEVSQLHTGKMEPTCTWRDYQVTVYCPRDTMHILLENPQTGGHQFWLLEKSRFDELYGDLTSFLDAKAEGEFYVDP